MKRSWYAAKVRAVCLAVCACGLAAATALAGAAPAAASLSQYSEWLDGKPLGAIPVNVPPEFARLRPSYDVIVAGTDPEGIAAAVSAARNGLKVLLVDGRSRDRLGGLMTVGWLNSIDMNRYSPNGTVLNRGIFSEWYTMVEGDSFDVGTAADAFNQLVAREPNIDVVLPVRAMEPVVDVSGTAPVVVGMKLEASTGETLTVGARAVIDATQDGDVFAAAGVPFTFGREDLGQPDAKMAVTLVFRVNGVTPPVWSGIRQRLRNKEGYGTTDRSAWGYSEMYGYVASQPNVKMRGLNIGRQNDNTALINALLLFEVDPLDPASVRSGMEAGMRELPRVVEHIRHTFPELSTLSYGGVASEPYVRESRHMIGEYRLNIIDLLENKDKWDRIAFGSYPVDLQPVSSTDTGNILFKPIKYAVPFRSIVPKQVDGLLAVGRAASFDTLAHGSARTIPVGMATGQAAGAAVKVAIERNVTFREMARSEEAIATLQARLNAQGMALEPYTLPLPNYMLHRTYSGLKTVVSFGLVKGKYNNDFRLDELSNPAEFGLLFSGSQSYFGGNMPAHVSAWLPQNPEHEAAMAAMPLTAERAASIAATALGLSAEPGKALETLQAGGYVRRETIDGIKNSGSLTFGESYMLFRDIAGALGFHAAVSSVR